MNVARAPKHGSQRLLLLGSSLTALAVARVAHRSGLQCIMADSQAGPAASTSTATFRRLRQDDFAALLEGVPDLRQREDVAVIADSDRWLRFVQRHHSALSRELGRVLHPSAEAIAICLDKTEFLRWCAQRDLPAPRVYGTAAEALRCEDAYPLLIRPEQTQHSAPTGLPKALEIRNRSELEHWLKRFAAVGVTPSICESLLRPGLRQFSVGAARDREGRTLTFLAEKVRPAAERCAGGTYVVSTQYPGIEELAAKALDALDFFGVAEIEVLYDPARDQGYLVEINARPWLQFTLPHLCGCDLLGHVLHSGYIAQHKARARASWLYFSSDLYACFSRSTGLVSTGKLSLLDYLRSILSADAYALWDWRDPQPLLTAVARTLRDCLRR